MESFCGYRAYSIITNFGPWARSLTLMCLSFLICKRGIILVRTSQDCHVLGPHFTTTVNQALVLTGPQDLLEAMPFYPGLCDCFPITAFSPGPQPPISQNTNE